MNLQSLYINILSVVLTILLGSLSGCIMEKPGKSRNESTEISARDLPEILKNDTLTVLIENSSTSYFIYKEKKMGFEYELLQQFAAEIGVALEVKVIHNLDNITDMLNAGQADILACNYTITKDRGRVVAFSEPFLETHQVLIQRRPENWKEQQEEEWRKQLLTRPSQLANHNIHVWKNSSYHQRLLHLQEEIGDTIFIQGVAGNIGGEELIEMVSEGLIDYTVIEENVARINEQFFDNIDAHLSLSFNQRMAFGLRKGSHLLKAKLDEWLISFKKTALFQHIYKKYFESESYMRPKDIPVSATVLDDTRISEFDDIFRKAGQKYGWDWRLIASVAYQESKFNPNVLGFGGSYGMMQFMPNTGPYYNVYPDSPPEVQIMGGAKKLSRDEQGWSSIPDHTERLKFALASYNAGKGHILDAQRLARKHGKNPNLWEGHVEEMLLNLSKQEFYQDEVVRHGMIRSKTTYHYVRNVMERYRQWSEAYPE